MPMMLNLTVLTTLTISDTITNSSTNFLNGDVFEDINHSGDGGIYGELLANRAFQGSNPSTANYNGINGAKMTLVHEPLSDALPLSLMVKGDGFWNSGWWGIKVEPTHYTARFYYKAADEHSTPPSQVVLKGVSSGAVYASAKPQPVTSDSLLYIAKSNGFQLYEAKLNPGMNAPDANNGLFLEGASGFFNYISLFGSTLNDRPNGLRKDIAESLLSVHSHFLRFPGANNLEGNTIAQRWQWNETIGPLIYRRGRQDPWGYSQTNGLGLHEYFEWMEDMKLEAILGVYDGYSLAPQVVSQGELLPFVENVLNELEYITGDPETTPYGKLRAQNGRYEPWPLHYVEIGNEDFISALAQTTYDDYRFEAFYVAIKTHYPNITIVATTKPTVFPKNDVVWWDQHNYLTPQAFIGMFNYFDNYPRNNTKPFLGEYAVTSFDNGTHVTYPTIYTATAEAVFMIGLERNSDQVAGSCYAPILNNEKSTQWYPDLISFNAGTDITVSTAYYVQQMFASNQGDKILSLENPTFDPLYYVANLNSSTNEVHIKIANPSGKSVSFSANVLVNGFQSDEVFVSAQAISSSDPDASNVPNQPAQVYLQEWPVSFDDDNVVSLEVGPYFVGVVTLASRWEKESP